MPGPWFLPNGTLLGRSRLGAVAIFDPWSLHYMGDARAIAFGRSTGVLSLESWLHFRPGSRLDRSITWGNAHADAVGRIRSEHSLEFC